MTRAAIAPLATRHGDAVIRLPRDGSTYREAMGLRFGVGIVVVAVSVPAIAMVASGHALPTPPIPVLLIVAVLVSGLLALAVWMGRRVRWSEIDLARGVTKIDELVSCAHSEVAALAWVHVSGVTQVGHLETPLSHVEEARFDLLFITRDARPEVHRTLAAARERWATTQSPKPLGLKKSSLGDALAADQQGVVTVAGSIAYPAAEKLRSRLGADLAVPVFERGPDGGWTLIPARPESAILPDHSSRSWPS